MIKRALDILGSTAGLVLLSPVFAVTLFLVWRQDGRSPFYIADRAARGGGRFRMVKIRSMIVSADKSGVESTSADDVRITPVGSFIRRWKIDELSQLWNVLRGEMSLVGPRPNTLREVETYSAEERRLLSIRPGITDLSSIVFSDEGDILKGSADPDRDYTVLIRPWKSKLGLVYVDNPGVLLDVQIIWLTVVAMHDKPRALAGVASILQRLGYGDDLRAVAGRKVSLEAMAPRGALG